MRGLLGADPLRDALEEVVLHHVWFGGAAGFAGDDEQRIGKIDLSLQGADLRWIRRVEHMQLRKTRLPVEGLRQHFGPEARSAHAEHDGVGEALSLYPVREVLI